MEIVAACSQLRLCALRRPQFPGDAFVVVPGQTVRDRTPWVSSDLSERSFDSSTGTLRLPRTLSGGQLRRMLEMPVRRSIEDAKSRSRIGCISEECDRAPRHKECRCL